VVKAVRPVFPSRAVSAAASSSSSSSSSLSSGVVVLFSCFDGGAPSLYYLQLRGNEEAIYGLRAIAATHGQTEFVVKLFSPAITQQTADALIATDPEDDDALRAALTAAFPDGPEGDGWSDRDMWTVKEIIHEPLPGAVDLLPLEPPRGMSANDYVTQVFSMDVRKLVRAD
jgi:hypothetical protein